MKAYVTGGTGFIGGHLVELLVERGYHVTCLVRKTSNLRWMTHLLETDPPRVQLVRADLHDPGALAPHLREVDLVFHLAGLTRAPDAATYDRVNAQGTKSLIEACLRADSPLDRFIYCSSLAAIGPSPDATPISEDAPPRPLTDYGRSKLKGESITREYANRLPITIIRPPAVYGPRDNDVLIFFRLIDKGVMPLIGDEHRLVSLVHVNDLVEGIYAAAVSNRALGRAYFLTDGAVHTWIAVENAIAHALKKRPFNVRIPFFLLDVVAIFAEAGARITGQTPLMNRQKARDLKQPFWICDSARAQKEIGYRPMYPLERGIQDTATWYRENGWLR